MASIRRSSPSATWSSTSDADRSFRHRPAVSVIGGSMGGMQVWNGIDLPHRVFSRCRRHRRPPFLAEHRLPRGRPASGDGRPDWRGGNIEAGVRPARAGWRAWPRTSPIFRRRRCCKFGRNLQDREALTSASTPISDRAICATRHHLRRALRRQLHLYMTRDGLFRPRRRPWRHACRGIHQDRALLRRSFTSDWLFPTEENRSIVHALNAAGASVSFVEIDTDRG